MNEGMTTLNTAITPDRRAGVPDRRRTPRGGRRAADLRRGVATLALLSLIGVSTASAQAVAGWKTSGTKILTPAGSEFVISGVNWYGFETTNGVAHGLWSRDYRLILDDAKRYGYNTIRLPFSNQMWETNPVPSNVGGCSACAGKRSRDIMAMIINYAGSIGLHVILDNHRSNAGNSAQESGLWYTTAYPEQAWIRDWVSVQEWVHGIPQTLGAPDTITVNTLAVDGAPTVIGFDLRNEPHTPGASYLSASTWGTGDGIDPKINPNPNPFAPACVASSTCHDWRLAAERAGTTILGEAARNGWEFPLIFVEGVSQVPAAGGNASSGPYEHYWWGGNLLGVNGNATNPGAPVVLNAGGSAAGLGAPVYDQLVYSSHDYGPSLYRQPWFNASTCYTSGCSPSSLADIWTKYWAHLSLPGGVNPVGPNGTAFPWSNTGHTPVTQAPLYIGEFGTGKTDADLYSSGNGSQGQWTTSMINFIQSSFFATKTPLNDSGIAVSNLHWTYWAFNNEDSFGVLGAGYTGLANAKKEYSFLCFIQQGALAVPMGSASGTCGSTGTLPAPDGAAPPPPATAPAAPTGLTAVAGNAQAILTWTAAAGATGHTVKFATTSGGPYQTIASGLATSLTHAGLVNGTTYYYVVTATNTAGESANSSEVSATPAAPVAPEPPAAAPTGLNAVAGNAQVSLTWTAVEGATGHTVKFATTSGGPYQTIATGLTASFTHAGLVNGTTYYYVVTASNSGGESANSTQVSATPVAPPTISNLSIWWPADGVTLSGTQPFKARYDTWKLTSYRMYWQVDGGQLNSMYDSYVDAPHKEAIVDVSTWSWRGTGPYVITFVAKDRKGKTIATQSVTIYVAR
jgi:fibronectin type 3 domain-containing protein